MNKPLLTGALALVLSSGAALAQGARIGPSFACPRPAPADGLAQMICDNPDMSREEVVFEQSYYALRQLYGKDGWKALKVQALNFNNNLRTACNIPQAGAVDQTMPANSATCYIAETEKDRANWLGQLTGPAHEEATRPIEQHIALQQRLVDLGFLSSATKVDGVYGEASRVAISTWQRVMHRPDVNSFLSDADAVALTQPAPVTPAPAPLASQPVATAAPSPTSGLADAMGIVAPTPASETAATQPVVAVAPTQPMPTQPAIMDIDDFLSASNTLEGKAVRVSALIFCKSLNACNLMSEDGAFKFIIFDPSALSQQVVRNLLSCASATKSCHGTVSGTVSTMSIIQPNGAQINQASILADSVVFTSVTGQ